MQKYSHQNFKPEEVKNLIKKSKATSKTLNQSNLSNKTTEKSCATDQFQGKDTLVFPLLQMRTIGVHQDEHVTRNILGSAPPNTDLLLATAYFNLTNNYWDALFETQSKVDLLMAHPKAMGFYKAPGMAGECLSISEISWISRSVSTMHLM